MRYRYIVIMGMLLFAGRLQAQTPAEPWRPEQLMPTRVLAEKIEKNQTAKMVIISVGPDAVIKGSVDNGPGRDPQNIAKLKTYLQSVPKDKEVVIYCGCCPFDRCPNIRPAFAALVEMGFKHAKLLDIPKNVKVDWLDKQYPANEQ